MCHFAMQDHVLKKLALSIVNSRGLTGGGNSSEDFFLIYDFGVDFFIFLNECLSMIWAVF